MMSPGNCSRVPVLSVPTPATLCSSPPSPCRLLPLFPTSALSRLFYPFASWWKSYPSLRTNWQVTSSWKPSQLFLSGPKPVMWFLQLPALFMALITFVYNIFLSCFKKSFLTTPHGMWDFSSLTTDWICALCNGRWSLNHWTARTVLALITFSSFNDEILFYFLLEF